MAPSRVAAVGDNCIDVYAGASVRSAVGGNALNVAVGLARRGIPTEYLGEVGDNAEGQRVLRSATGAGVGMGRVRVAKGRTWLAFIVVGPDGVAHVDHEDPGACGPFTPSTDEIEFLAGFDHVHMANLADPTSVIRALHERGVSTSYDYGKAVGWGSGGLPRIVFASSDGDDALPRGVRMAREACARGARLAIVMLGAAGSVAFDGEQLHTQSPTPISPIDTLGAGDSYIAAFLASHLAGAPLEAAMRSASDAASETCLHWAAWPQPASSETPPLLQATGIRKDYGHVRALDGVDFDLRPREIHALVGDNGAGKSTLIKIIAGALRPDAGTLEIDGKPVVFNSPHDAREAGIETVYQDLALADPLDAAENVFLGREICYPGLLGRLGFVDRAAMRKRTQEHLRDLAVSLPSISVPVETFSGGQRQAVAVARASVWGQRFLIMDEPVAALGVQQTTHVVDLMQRTRDEKGLSVILISHNLPEVLRVADRITVLRLGRRVGTVAARDASATLLVAAMTGALPTLGQGSSA